MELLLAIVAIVIGLAVLVWSADTFIDGATEIAVKFNVPTFLIGALIVGIGTSAPELIVSAIAAYDGSPGLALGNAYGSNIVNISLILGLTVLISPMIIKSNVVKQDMLLLIAVTGLAAWQLVDGELSRTDGWVLMAALAAVVGLQIYMAIRNNVEEDLPDTSEVKTGKAIATLVFGLVLLILSSRAVVWGAVELATLWGMSELIIGLTIVAIGTSLPELVASITAARRGEHEMALGNIVGSNIFNTLGVVGLAAIIHPMAVDPSILSRDMLMVGLLTLLLFVLCLVAFKSSGYMKRTSGFILLASFVGYTAWLIQSAAG